jgi:hypothetical protein
MRKWRGGSAGGHHYALKMYVYEKVRARNFGRAWGYIQVDNTTLFPFYLKQALH